MKYTFLCYDDHDRDYDYYFLKLIVFFCINKNITTYNNNNNNMILSKPISDLQNMK